MENNNEIGIGNQILIAALTSIAASFPVLASLAAGWNEYKNITQVRNFNDILSRFAQELTVLKENVDQNYLGSDELKKLIWQVITKGKDENIEEKRQYYAEYLANATTNRLSRDTEKEMILETISKLSIRQIELLADTASKINDMHTENINRCNDENDRPSFIRHVNDEEPTREMAISNESDTAIIDYMLSIGVFEHALQRRTYIQDGVRAFTISGLGWRVLQYLDKC